MNMMCHVVVLLSLFNFIRSEFIYSVYNISSVPPLDNICGLSRAQITAAQQSCFAKKRSPPAKQTAMHVLAACTGNECSAERQRELIDCLAYEEIVSQNLDEQLALDERSLAGQLAAATDQRERSTAALFEAANRLNAANCEYHESVVAAETASRELCEQREIVRNARALVSNLTTQLAEAKASMAAHVQLKQDSDEFSVYATGNQKKNNEHQCADGTASDGVNGLARAAAVGARTTTTPPPLALPLQPLATLTTL